jgi:CMP-N-acetylneuraminic acid synthetase
MITALIIGRAGSSGIPGKNILKILDRPMMAYPLLAAQNSKYCEKIFVSTDCQNISEIGRRYNAQIIDRPDYLASNEALAEDAYIHGYEQIRKTINQEPEFLILMFCNGATVLSKYIDEAVELLRADPNLDSVTTASEYNMFSPLRAKKIDENGKLIPFVPVEYFGEDASCDRGSQGDVWFADCSLFVVRPHCMNKRNGYPPFTWLGKNVKPLKQVGGQDIDSEWQVPIVEHWLRKNGFGIDYTPYK